MAYVGKVLDRGSGVAAALEPDYPGRIPVEYEFVLEHAAVRVPHDLHGLVASAPGMNTAGLVTVASAFPVRETIDRLSRIVEAHDLRIFARIDHSANAVDVGADLRPTELLIFGHPRAGTALMLDRQTAGIDLPVKALAWQDVQGRTWLTYNDANWMGERHGLGSASAPILAAIESGLAAVTAQAAALD